jgi:excisionase family DNA binding protein
MSMPTTTPAPRRRRHLDRVGNSIPLAAKKLRVGEGTLRRAIDRGEVKVIEFGGLRRIPDAEIARIKEMLGLLDDEPREAAPLGQAEAS